MDIDMGSRFRRECVRVCVLASVHATHRIVCACVDVIMAIMMDIDL